MVVEVEKKILQGFAKHPEQGIVEKERGQEAASKGASRGTLSLAPPPPYIGGRVGWGAAPTPMAGGQNRELEVDSSLPKRKVFPPPQETLGFPRWGGQAHKGLVRLAQ